MERTLPRPLAIPWHFAALALYVTVNVGLIALVPFTAEVDNELWAAAWGLAASGRLYDHGLPGVAQYVWSPLMVPVMAFAAWLGPLVWGALHVAVLFLLRDWRLIALALVSWSFWRDALYGGPMALALVLGVLALRGSRPSALAYIALVTLIPRPIYFPLAVWLLWRDRKLWTPAAAIVAVHAVIVAMTGYLPEWVAATLSHGSQPPVNLGPTALVGLWWLLLAIPLAVWLTRRGWPGTAGIVMAPYVLPSYLLFPLIDFGHRDRPD